MNEDVENNNLKPQNNIQEKVDIYRIITIARDKNELSTKSDSWINENEKVLGNYLRALFHMIAKSIIKSSDDRSIDDTKKIDDMFNNVSVRNAILEHYKSIYSENDHTYIAYFLIMGALSNIQQEKTNRANELDDILDIFKRDKNNLGDENIKSYVSCIRESIKNYYLKGFNQSFIIYFDDLVSERNKLNSLFLDEDCSLTIAIQQEQFFHLVGLPNFDNQSSIIIKFYNDYLIQKNKQASIESYFEFLQNKDGYEFYLSLFFKDNLKEQEQECVNRLLDNQTKEQIKKQLIDLITKSFEKSINFRKVYEFLLIPEIVMDYEADSGEHVKDYKYAKKTVAYTPLTKSDVIEISNPDLEEKKKEIRNKLIELVPSTKNIDKLILFLEKNNLLEHLIWIKNEKSRFIKFSIKSKTDSYKNGEQYTFDAETDDDTKIITSDYPPSMMLLSYDKELIYNLEKKSKLSMFLAFIFTCYGIYSDPIMKTKIDKYLDSDTSKKAFNDFKEIYGIEVDDINYIFENLMKCDLSEMENDFSELEIILSKPSNKKMLYFPLLLIIFKSLKNNCDIEKLIDKLTNAIGLPDNQSIDKIVYDKELIEEIKKLINNFISNFEISDRIALEFPKKELLMNEFLKLATDIFLSMYRQPKYQTPIDLIGYAVKRDESKVTQSFVSEVYPKTFAGKTVLQLLYDLRINGYGYFVKYIMTPQGLSNIPLVSTEPKVKIEDLEVELNEYGYSIEGLGNTFRK